MILSAIQSPMGLTSLEFSRSRVRRRKDLLYLHSLVGANESTVIILSAQGKRYSYIWLQVREENMSEALDGPQDQRVAVAMQGFPSGQTQLQATASRHCRPCHAGYILLSYIKPVPDLSQRQLIVKRRKFWTLKKPRIHPRDPASRPKQPLRRTFCSFFHQLCSLSLKQLQVSWNQQRRMKA